MRTRILAILLAASSCAWSGAPPSDPLVTAAYTLDGHGLVNGQLLDNAQAAALVQGMGPLPYDNVELGPQATINIAGDDYYQNAPTASYANELALYVSGNSCCNWFPAWVVARVDGKIPINNPTFAQINAWAALKWGLNPALGLGEAMVEDGYNIDSPGDTTQGYCTGNADIWGGCSTGPEQIADRGPNHAWLGLTNNNLAAESLPFAMDFYYMTYYVQFAGLWNHFGHVNAGDIVNAIQYWCGSPTNCPNYSTNVLNAINAKGWVAAHYNGVPFTIAPPTGTMIPNL